MTRAASCLRWVAVGTVVCAVIASCGTRLPRHAFTGDPSLGTGGAAASTPTTASRSDNPASDTGVTPSQVLVGLIVSETSPLGADTFSGPMYGALSYFQSVNRRGGVHGRTVKAIVCDDGATGSGDLACARKLVEADKVFAFAGNSIFDYAAAPYVSGRDVPDVGGEPIGNEYDQYQHLYSVYGSTYPRNGTVGYNGKLSGGTEVYRYFKTALGSRVAGVVYYNQADSQRYGDLTAAGLQLEGYTVVREQVDFAVPNFDAAAIDMRAHHVDTVFDALDGTGNVNLCSAMEAAGLTVKAKVSTVQNWSEAARTDYRATPKCRNALYATAQDRNYMDTQYPAVAQFRSDMQAAFPERADRLSMWEEEGWASGQWLSDAMTSCGAALTRRCIEAYLNRPVVYTGHGLLTGATFVVSPPDVGTTPHCLNVARWQDSAYGGGGGWVTTTPNKDFVCYDVPSITYSP